MLIFEGQIRERKERHPGETGRMKTSEVLLAKKNLVTKFSCADYAKFTGKKGKKYLPQRRQKEGRYDFPDDACSIDRARLG